MHVRNIGVLRTENNANPALSWLEKGKGRHGWIFFILEIMLQDEVPFDMADPITREPRPRVANVSFIIIRELH